MVNEYKLSLTAAEIEKRLENVNQLSEDVSSLQTDVGTLQDDLGELTQVLGGKQDKLTGANGQVVGFDADGNAVAQDMPSSGGSVQEVNKAIIDVFELPTENINKNSWYRLVTGKFVYNQYEQDDWRVICADGLPEVGEPVSTDMANVTAYCNMQDGGVYAYINDLVSSASGAPIGWYPLATLAPAFDLTFNGVIFDIDDDPCDDSFRILLKYDFYMYQDGWCKLPFACEKAPKMDIAWDGVIGDRFALDVSSLGFTNTYFVKVSDEVFTIDQIIGCAYTQSRGYANDDIHNSEIDTATYPGALNVDSGVVIVHSSDILNAALGLPAGYLTNGTYFVLDNNRDNYTNHLVSPSKITKIDSKFLDIDIDMSNIYTKSEVETLIANAIGGAIGGSY